MGFKEHIQSEKESMEALLKRMERSAAVLPDTKLYIKNDGQGKGYYITTPENPNFTYIGWRNNSDLLRQLLEREKARENILRMRENVEILERMMSEYGFAEEVFPPEAGYIPKRGRRHFPPSQNPYRRHELIHDTGLGFYTRTKSEAIVARRLYAFGFHFQYEKELRVRDLDGMWKSIYPDFTIFLDDGRVLYLEHVGMLQDDEYRQKFSERTAVYHKNNLLLSRDVFITMDGPGGDIDISAVDTVLRGLHLR